MTDTETLAGETKKPDAVKRRAGQTSRSSSYGIPPTKPSIFPE